MTFHNITPFTAWCIISSVWLTEFFITPNLSSSIKSSQHSTLIPFSIHLTLMLIIGGGCIFGSDPSFSSIITASLLAIFVLFRVIALTILSSQHKTAANILLNVDSIPDHVSVIPIVMLIAHPDDESMFFSPLLTLIQHYNKHCAGVKGSPRLDLHIVCLTNGSGGGIGATRTRELILTSWFAHGISEDRVIIVNDPRLPDSMSLSWEVGHVVDHISQHVLRITQLYNKPKTAASPSSSSSLSLSKRSNGSLSSVPHVSDEYQWGEIQRIIFLSFDANGVSGHINHKACYQGIKVFIDQMKSNQNHPLHHYTYTSWGVTTIPLVYKYLFTLGPLALITHSLKSPPTHLQDSQSHSLSFPTIPLNDILYIPNMTSYHSWYAMKLHHSQFVWFRKLFILFSFYTYATPLTLLDQRI